MRDALVEDMEAARHLDSNKLQPVGDAGNGAHCARTK
jgi:hypothetical protein